MSLKQSRILVTGGAGFIASAFVRLLARSQSLKERPLELIVIDKLTYAGDLARLNQAWGSFKFYQADICDKIKIEKIFDKERPDTVLNFAAESHVDRSISDSCAFVNTNVLGTDILLGVSKRHDVNRFIQVSTDEVYGDTVTGKFNEDSKLNPSSPYASSKAAADLLIKSYIRTFKFPAIIVRPSNNYGPWQYPEKLIPLAVLKILKKGKVPVYGRGRNIREWLYVDDCARGIMSILERGKTGEIYNLGSGREMKNIDVVKLLLRDLKGGAKSIKFVEDRPGHDIRYRLNSKKVRSDTGWAPEVRFEKGLQLTALWCFIHRDWLFSKWKDVAPLYRKK